MPPPMGACPRARTAQAPLLKNFPVSDSSDRYPDLHRLVQNLEPLKRPFQPPQWSMRFLRLA